MSEATTVVEATTTTRAGSSARAKAGGLMYQLTRSPSGFAGLILVLVIVIPGLILPSFIAQPASNVDEIWLRPGGAHPLGTNGSGQDILQMMLVGGRTVILVGFGAAALTTVIAVSLGSLAAYFRGRFDATMLQITDIVMTIPQIVLLAVMGAFFNLDSTFALAVLIGALSWPVLMRSIRAQVLSLREREFVEASRLLDLGTARIVFGEIVPNMASYILINFIIAVNGATFALVGMYLLGLAPLKGANWGIMINDAWMKGAMFNPDAMAYIFAPVTALVLLQLGLIMLSRSLEEILNPRLRDR